NCHSIFDPIGFGFENYDETGRFREDEHGISIDASGSIPVSTPIETFESQEELATALAEMPAVHSCVSGNMKTFVYGVEDACLGESKREALINGEVGLLDYLASLAGEPHF